MSKMKTTTIIAAIKDRRLFGSLPRFKKLESWNAWLVALKAVFGLPMTADDMVIYERCTGRKTVPVGGAKESYFIVGRRGGKSWIAAVVGVFIAFFVSFKDYLTTGERGVVLVLAVDRNQAKVVFNYARGIIRAIPILSQMIAAWRADEIELDNGIVLAIKASDYRSVRGVTVVCCILDELAFWPSEGLSPDNEVLTAIKPAMITIPEARLVAISTGYGMVGTLYDAHKQYFAKEVDDVLVWQSSTVEMNPTVDRKFIDKEIERDPIANSAEYGGLFRDDVSAAFPLSLIESCTVTGRPEQPFIETTLGGYYGFADPSALKRDWYVGAVAHRHRTHDKVVFDRFMAFGPGSDTRDVCKALSDMFVQYHVQTVVGDNYAGTFPARDFKDHNIMYVPCDRHKSDLYLELVQLMNSKRVELIDDPIIAKQLRTLERRRGKSGKDTITHPERVGIYDDIVNAIAGVCHITYAGLGGSIDELLAANAGYPTHRTMDPRCSWVEQGETSSDGGSTIARMWDSGELFKKRFW